MYDSATAAAVTLFETDNGLSTGGTTTLAFRNAVIAQLNPNPMPVIVGMGSGSSGPQEYTLGADLGLLGYNVGSSGVYDTATTNAVMAFEQSHGLATGGKTTIAFRDAILAALRGPGIGRVPQAERQKTGPHPLIL